MVWPIRHCKVYRVRTISPIRVSMIDGNRALAAQYEASGIKVYVTGDGADVYEDRFLSLATKSGTGFQPVLLLVGTRLGIDRVNPVYWDALRHVLQLPQSLGIAGYRSFHMVLATVKPTNYEQGSAIRISLLRGCARQSFLLPGPASNTALIAISRRPSKLHSRGSRILSHATPSSVTHGSDGSEHADCIPHQGSRGLDIVEESNESNRREACSAYRRPCATSWPRHGTG